jgi:predicted kinase
MIQLNVTVGLPGCGKTTRARRWVADAPGRTRVNRDDLREMMFGGWTGDQVHEDAVTAAQLAAVRALLAAGVGVVVDDTNIRPERIERLCRIGWDLDATVGIWDMTSVPVDDCVRRDEARGLRGERCVGEAVIRGMHALLVHPVEEGLQSPGRAGGVRLMTDRRRPTMRRTLTRVAIVVVALAALLVGAVATAQPAQAASVVYVDLRVPGTWWGATQYGVAYTDRYTSSTVVWAPCPSSAAQCVIIRSAYIRSDWVAVTYPGWHAYIYVNPYDQWYGFTALANTMAHEYAHTRGVTWHTYTCTNIMFYRLRCSGGALRPWRFTDYQRSVLAGK